MNRIVIAVPTCNVNGQSDILVKAQILFEHSGYFVEVQDIYVEIVPGYHPDWHMAADYYIKLPSTS